MKLLELSHYLTIQIVILRQYTKMYFKFGGIFSTIFLDPFLCFVSHGKK